jgi:hypothetical protein
MANTFTDNSSVDNGSGGLDTVGISFSGVIATFYQTVDLASNFSGVIATFNQDVISEFSGVIATFSQRVEAGDSAFFTRWGYDIELIFPGQVINTSNLHAANGLTGQMQLQVTESQSRLLTFTIIPPEGVQDLEQYVNKPVTLNVKTSSGVFTVFVGYVDLPKYDILSRKLTLECTDRRNNRIIQLPAGVVENIGTYSEDIFGQAKDKSEELEKRLETVPSSFDFDNAGNYGLTPWAVQTPHFTLGNSAGEVYFRKPEVIKSNRTKTVNTYDLTVTYTYQRLHQQACTFTWPGYDSFCSDYWNQGKPSFPTKQAILSAAKGSNWKIITRPSINYVNLWPAQGFTCGGNIVWQPNRVENEYAARLRFDGYLKDSLGNFVTVNGVLQKVYTQVVDVNGQPIIDIVKQTITDTSSDLCRGASWTSAIRFSQNITESYYIRMASDQSVLENGEVLGEYKVDLDDPFDTDSWENGDQITYTSSNFYINKKPQYSKLNSALRTVLNKTRTDILRLHRDVTVKFSRPIWPQIDLKHTVEIDVSAQVPGWTQGLHAIGKVGSFTHTFNFSDHSPPVTAVDLYLSRAMYTGTDDPWLVGIPNEDPSYIGPTRTVRLGTHVGQNPDPEVTPGADLWNGYIGNAEITENAYTYRTQFTESFVVDFPEISDNIRGNLTYYSQNNTFNVAIPSDTLEVSF